MGHFPRTLHAVRWKEGCRSRRRSRAGRSRLNWASHSGAHRENRLGSSLHQHCGWIDGVQREPRTGGPFARRKVPRRGRRSDTVALLVVIGRVQSGDGHSCCDHGDANWARWPIRGPFLGEGDPDLFPDCFTGRSEPYPVPKEVGRKIGIRFMEASSHLGRHSGGRPRRPIGLGRAW